LRHREHEPFFAKHLDRVPSRVAADPELLLNDLLARQRVKVSQLPVLNPGAQDPCHLLIQGHVRELINHVANVDHLPYVAIAAYVGNVCNVGYAVGMDAPVLGDSELTRIRDAELAELRQNWDHVYRVWYEAGQFCAMRRDDGAIVRRGDADDLHDEIRCDYGALAPHR
jgi:hypothetical protein